jgi:hypothetical protein
MRYVTAFRAVSDLLVGISVICRWLQATYRDLMKYFTFPDIGGDSNVVTIRVAIQTALPV